MGNYLETSSLSSNTNTLSNKVVKGYIWEFKVTVALTKGSEIMMCI